MRVGTITYATNRGLSHLARDFHRHGIITDVMVMEHASIPTNLDWYPGAQMTQIRTMDRSMMHQFCLGMDAVLFFETPFDWQLFDVLRGKVRTYLVTMYECTPKNHVRPDVYLCPSLLDMEIFGGYTREKVTTLHPFEFYTPNLHYTPLPVEYPWRLRTHARHFVHNGGYLGVKSRKTGVMREGTTTLIEAMQHVKSPIKLTIRVQENIPAHHQRLCAADPRIEYLPGQVRYGELYATGDVAVGAQRWNGCSLPLQEAFASGMMVINTDRFPMNTWLPREPLVPPSRYIEGSCIGGPYMLFQEAVVEPEDLAREIDVWYGAYISDYSVAGREWAERNSWDVLGRKWKEVLSR